MAKIQGELLEQIRAAVAPLDNERTRQAYRDRRIPRGELVKDIDTRYRMDLFGAIHGTYVPFAAFDAVEGLTDAHILTAMRTVVPAL